MAWHGMAPKRELALEALYGIFHAEHRAQRMTIAEAGPHWECRYVEKGELTVAARGGEERRAPAGYLFFRAPGETQTYRVTGARSARVLVIAFSSHSPLMEKCRSFLRVDARQRALLDAISEEKARGFTESREGGERRLLPREDAPPGAIQLLFAFCEELFLSLLPERAWRARSEGRSAEELFSLLSAYMEEHLDGKLSLAELAEVGGTSPSTVKAVFRRETGKGALAFFIRKRIARAEAYLAEGGRSATEVASLLGYESIHYFSRQFRAVTGLSPGAYAARCRGKAKSP